MTPEEADEREERFALTVRTNGVLWTLRRGEGFANWKEDDESIVIPVWLSESDAEDCALVSFPGYAPSPVNLLEFLESYIPSFSERGIWLAVQPAPELAGNQHPAKRIKEMLMPM